MQIAYSQSNQIERILLIEDGKTLLAVAPGFGAKLTDWRMVISDKAHEILWPVSDEDLHQNAWYKQSFLFPYPNRLKDGKYTHSKKHYQFPVNEEATGNQLHGMLFNAPFQLVQHEIIGGRARFLLEHAYTGDKDYFPFPYTFRIEYQYEYNQLKVLFEVENTGEQSFPFGIGWHPYFQLDGIPVKEYQLWLPEIDEITLNKRSLPTGTFIPHGAGELNLAGKKLDHCYRLVERESGYELNTGTLNLKFSIAEDFEYLQLFTPDNGETIAIEPMTCNINAFNNGEGLKYLKPKECFRGWVLIEGYHK